MVDWWIGGYWRCVYASVCALTCACACVHLYSLFFRFLILLLSLFPFLRPLSVYRWLLLLSLVFLVGDAFFWDFVIAARKLWSFALMCVRL